MENLPNTNQPMQQNTGKQENTVAVLGYIFWVGWVIAYVMFTDKNKNNKTEFNTFHLKQAFGVHVFSTAIYILSYIFGFMPMGWILENILYLAGFAMMIFGLIAAINHEQKLLPVVGEFFQKTFNIFKNN